MNETNQSEQELSVPGKPMAEELPEEKIFSKPFIYILGALLFAVFVGGGVFVWSKNQAPKYVVVDLVKISTEFREQARKKALADRVTDEQRGLILELYKKQMNEIQTVLDKEAEKCQCTIFVKSAIVADGAGAVDITPRIERALKQVK